MKKTALIFGVTGQDGSYLCELLLKKNYEVHGEGDLLLLILEDRHLYQDPYEKQNFTYTMVMLQTVFQ